MPFDRDGFLGKDALKMAEQIRENHKELFEICYEINRLAQKTKNEVAFNGQHTQAHYAALFFIRIIECSQAAIILIERGFYSQASIILRTAFETFVYLIHCVDDKDFYKEYLEYSNIGMLKDLKMVLEDKIYEKDKRWGGAEKVKEEISELEGKFPNKKRNEIKKKFSKKKLAENAGMLDSYRSFYSVTSDHVHTGIAALHKPVELDKNRDLFLINHGPSDTNARENLVMAAAFEVNALLCACKLFGIDKNSEIQKYRERLKEYGPSTFPLSS